MEAKKSWNLLFTAIIIIFLLASVLKINSTQAQGIEPIPSIPTTTIPTTGGPGIATRPSSASTKGTSSASTFSFGGRILSTRIGGVVCTAAGFGPLILSSNVGGAVNATTSVAGKGTTGQKVVGGVTGIYSMIPFFATNIYKVPKDGGFILGRAEVIPNFSICYINSVPPIPFPVRITNYYGVSSALK